MTGNSVIDSLFGLPWMELLPLVPAGTLLGLLYFGSLWFTTGKLLHSRYPVRWLLGSSLLRLALLLPALYWLTDARWQNMLACLGGFLVGRVLILRLSAAWQSPVSRSHNTLTTPGEAMSVNSKGMQQEHPHAP